jgi:glycosyltransferase involved in cell wall biosynthesis
VRDECVRRIGFAPTLRPLGIDVTRFATEHPPFGTPGRPTILHPARLLPWKGVHVTVQALAILASREVDARLVVTDTARIADWEGELAAYRSQVLALIHQHGLGGSVELCAVPYSAMPDLYQDADVVVYPTVAEEPYGLVPLEAMAAGRPVVATRSGGIPETVVDGVTGWLVEPGDPSELADRLAHVLANPDEAVRMGAAGRDRVVQHFDLEWYLDETLDSYRQASSEK